MALPAPLVPPVTRTRLPLNSLAPFVFVFDAVMAFSSTSRMQLASLINPLGNNAVAHAAIGQGSGHLRLVEIVWESRVHVGCVDEVSAGLAVCVIDFAGLVPCRAPAPFFAERHGAQSCLGHPEATIAQQSVFHIRLLSQVDLAFPSGRQGNHPRALGRFRGWSLFPNLALWLLLSAVSLHTVTLTLLYRYVQDIFTIRSIAVRYQYGTAASEIFRGGRRGAALWARRAAAARSTAGALPPDSGFGRRS